MQKGHRAFFDEAEGSELSRSEKNKKRRERYKWRIENEPGFKERMHAKYRREYENNKEKYNERRKQWARDNRERQREYARNYYAKNRDSELRKILERRYKNNPTIGLYELARKVARGECQLDYAIERYNSALTRICENDREK